DWQSSSRSPSHVPASPAGAARCRAAWSRRCQSRGCEATPFPTAPRTQGRPARKRATGPSGQTSETSRLNVTVLAGALAPDNAIEQVLVAARRTPFKTKYETDRVMIPMRGCTMLRLRKEYCHDRISIDPDF